MKKTDMQEPEVREVLFNVMSLVILSFVPMLRRDRMDGISVSQCILGMAELEEIRMIQSRERQR